uniref:FRAS1-related extracellular matrix protein N-terminal domain-containing protein n=1 Tax=Xiphophorus couchianus TaxID=32473 RepID=A0A3B5LP84_9TELE
VTVPVLLLLLVSASSSLFMVKVNPGVQVLRGRSVSITELDLEIQVDPSSDCKVEVVLNEPVTQWVGKLTPQMFDCSFLKDEVRYVHNGSPLLDEDSVLLRVYRFTASHMQVETVVLRVKVVDGGSSVVELGGSPLVVPRFFGLSNALNSTVLNIRTQEDLVCTVRLMTAETKFPTIGRLVNRDDSGLRRVCPGNKPCLHHTTEVQFLKTSCQNFLSSGLRYQHLSPPSPDTDYIPIRVELREKALWLPVLIQGAVQNQPPKPGFVASSVLEVDQFILTPLSTATLDATDPETPQARLVFNVTAPPAEGFITHLEDHTRPVGSFTWLDLHDMKVAYQPPNSSQSLRRSLQVEFQAIDCFFTSSSSILVHLSIRMSETNAPRVSWNMGLDLLEGQSRPITWEELQVVDKDNINAVHLVAVDGPAHGRLSVRGVKAFMFQVRDLKEGVVIYHHSDSDSTRDHIIFRISDGHHSIRHKFPINILPKDDSPPFLINNVAVEVPEGGAVRLQEYLLLATDTDSSDDLILYQMVSAPGAGRLVRKSSTHQTGVSVDGFLQKDLIQGQIYYQHSGDETFEDSFDILLSDSHQPPNLSQTYTVVVHVFPVKDLLPVEAPGTVRSLVVRETEVVHVSQSQLHFTDRENPDSDLTYIITQSCFSPLQPGYGTRARLMDAGRLFYADSSSYLKKDPTVPGLKSFTQHAVNHMKVAFMPPVEDIGPDPLFVQFAFSVSDPHGGTVSGLVFNITVTPVDNLPPEAFTNLLRVEEGGAAFVTEEHLLVQDRDSPEEELRVEVQKMARHGWLELQGGVLLQGGEFRLPDLRGLQLRYIHDDSETRGDEVGLKVTDGQNSKVVVLQVRPMNDEPPRLGGGLRTSLSCEEGGRVQVTADFLSATDQDGDDSRLTYMLARSPGRGELQRAGGKTDKFSQQDLLQGHVYYVHSGAEIGPGPVFDTVTLIISDGEAGVMDDCCHGDVPPPPVPLHGTLPVYDLNITVLPVNNKVPEVTLGKTIRNQRVGPVLVSRELGPTWISSECSDKHLSPDSLREVLVSSDQLHDRFVPLHRNVSSAFPGRYRDLDVAAHRVCYTHSNDHDSDRALHITDLFSLCSFVITNGASSRAGTLLFTIERSDRIPPTLSSNAGLRLQDGSIAAVTPDLLRLTDPDTVASNLTFVVTLLPRYGKLLLRGAPMPSPPRFLQSDIDQLDLAYRHVPGSPARPDRFCFLPSDGTNKGYLEFGQLKEEPAVFSIQVEQVDRVAPSLDRLDNPSTVTDLGAGRYGIFITSRHLRGSDPDSPAELLEFSIITPPQFGSLENAATGRTSGRQRFTQRDLDRRSVLYVVPVDVDVTTDGFWFRLVDPAGNEAPPHSFNSSLSSVRSRKDAGWMWRLAGRKSFWIGHDLWVWDESHSAKLRGAPAKQGVKLRPPVAALQVLDEPQVRNPGMKRLHHLLAWITRTLMTSLC